MFADYRVPQVLHHLRMLRYPSSLVKALTAHIPFANGSREEVSVRAASVLAVERVRDEIIRLREKKADGDGVVEVSSVLIDFYLWELAKNVESGMDRVEGLTTNKTLPAHRTRSIWY